MKKVSISEAKNGLSALIDQVKAGKSIVILDRGRPVARLEPVGNHAEARLEQLVREGIVRPPLKPFPRGLIASPPPDRCGKKTLLDALLEERREGR
ncbi:MAG: type II toxin-antitoxin system prevent-host-death family antitoxin [Cyanobacteria bacterium]|nr:type II toxin-antitoxin system prevent-host-death family antitoxin [Cyanobacteriota bacterium]